MYFNGYLLVRYVLFESAEFLLDDALVEELFMFIRIYVKLVLVVVRVREVHGFVHIIGGGIVGNFIRILLEGVHVILSCSVWFEFVIFVRFCLFGVSDEEMDKIFNLGLGMVIIIFEEEV